MNWHPIETNRNRSVSERLGTFWATQLALRMWANRNALFQTSAGITKLVSVPLLLIASMFSRFISNNELQLNSIVCLGALFFIPRALQLKDYSWAAGLASLAIVFSPALLVVKVGLLMGLTCIVTFATLFAAFRYQPLQAARA